MATIGSVFAASMTEVVKDAIDRAVEVARREGELAVLAEREACAQIVEAAVDGDSDADIAARIRVRK